MRSVFLAFALLTAGTCFGSPRVDNVLIRMVPPGATSLVGAHMDQLLASDLYRKLAAQQKLPQLDQFARETGFDPRRDVREILSVTTSSGTVLLARGRFDVKQAATKDIRIVRHSEYNIRVVDQSGFCILDSTLAAAGELTALEAALDEWKSNGSHRAAQPLLKTVGSLNDRTPLWGVSTGFAAFLAQNLPRAERGGIDFTSIFKGIETSWFSATVDSGFQASIHCTTATEKDAMNLRDAAKGLIGFGRLSTPENNPDLLRLWDGFTVEQEGRAFSLNADISGNLIDELVKMFSTPGGRGRGGRGRSGRASGRA